MIQAKIIVIFWSLCSSFQVFISDDQFTQHDGAKVVFWVHAFFGKDVSLFP
jgi:hypothetical protein